MFSLFKTRQRIPVLCYHSINHSTTSYLGNDHIALAHDLEMLAKHGYRLIEGIELIHFIKGEKTFSAKDKVACLSIDDAPTLDYYSYDSHKVGFLDGFKHIFYQSQIFLQSNARILNFAIADKTARQEIDIACIQGRGNMTSDWWENSIDEQLYNIANHSYDHMHDVLLKTAHSRGEKGNFYAVDNYQDADKQIRQAYELLQRIVNGKATPLFGYPYGHTNDYLVNEYFPKYQHEHKQLGAFTTAGEYVTRNCNRWAIPRFVCGLHWQTPEQFEKILLGAI